MFYLRAGLELLKVEKVSVHPVVYINSAVRSYLRCQHHCYITQVKVEEDWGQGTALLHPTRNIKRVRLHAPHLYPRLHTVVLKAEPDL